MSRNNGLSEIACQCLDANTLQRETEGGKALRCLTCGNADQPETFIWGSSTRHTANGQQQVGHTSQVRQTLISSSSTLKSLKGQRKLWLQGNARAEPSYFCWSPDKTKREPAAKLRFLTEHLMLCSEATEQPQPRCSVKWLHVSPNPRF